MVRNDFECFGLPWPLNRQKFEGGGGGLSFLHLLINSEGSESFPWRRKSFIFLIQANY